jgi:hypothetical protein
MADQQKTASVAKPSSMYPDFSGDDRKSSAATTPDFSIYSSLSMAHQESPLNDEMHLFEHQAIFPRSYVNAANGLDAPFFGRQPPETSLPSLN